MLYDNEWWWVIYSFICLLVKRNFSVLFIIFRCIFSMIHGSVVVILYEEIINYVLMVNNVRAQSNWYKRIISIQRWNLCVGTLQSMCIRLSHSGITGMSEKINKTREYNCNTGINLSLTVFFSYLWFILMCNKWIKPN